MRLKVSQAAEVALGRQRAPQYETGENLVPYLRSANIEQHRIDITDVKTMNFTPAEQATFSLADGDVLVTEGSGSRDAVGASAVWRSDLPGTVCFQNTLLRVRPRQGLSDGRYIAWWLRHAHGSGQMAEAASGANILHLGSDGLKRLTLELPPLGEQRRIADFLDDRVSRIDNIIAARHRQITLERREWVAALDLTISSSSGARVRAGRVLQVLPGYAFPSDGFVDYPYAVRLLRGTNLGVRQTDWSETVYWPVALVGGLGPFALEVGDIVMGMDRPWISEGCRIAQITSGDLPALLLQRVLKFLPGPLVRDRFLFWAFQSSEFREGVESELTGLSVPHLSGDQVRSYKMPLPSLERQDSIVDELDHADDVRRAHEQVLNRSIQLLTEYKQSLITAAVTGEFDVTTASTVVPA